ncbi:hypothetical protein VPH35_108694 [Triticum aestivum]
MRQIRQFMLYPGTPSVHLHLLIEEGCLLLYTRRPRSSDLWFMFTVPLAYKMMLACLQTSQKGNCVGKQIDAHVCTCVLYYYLYYIGSLGRPLPCRVRSLGRPRDNKKYILLVSAGWRSHGELPICYFARVLHPAMVSLSFPYVVDSATSS